MECAITSIIIFLIFLSLFFMVLFFPFLFLSFTFALWSSSSLLGLIMIRFTNSAENLASFYFQRKPNQINLWYFCCYRFRYYRDCFGFGRAFGIFTWDFLWVILMRAIIPNEIVDAMLQTFFIYWLRECLISIVKIDIWYCQKFIISFKFITINFMKFIILICNSMLNQKWICKMFKKVSANMDNIVTLNNNVLFFTDTFSRKIKLELKLLHWVKTLKSNDYELSQLKRLSHWMSIIKSNLSIYFWRREKAIFWKKE